MAEENHRLHKALLWGTGLSAAIGLSPYLLPYVGVGSTTVRDRVIALCGGSVSSFGSHGSGLTGFLNSHFAEIPVVGESLAAGGWPTAIASGILGVGGTMLGNYVSAHYDKPGQIPWGKIIKYAAIATSFLVALPGLLSGISMGLTYLAMVAGGGDASMASTLIGKLTDTLGFMGPAAMKATGSTVGGFVSQAVCCGVGALPAMGSALMPAHVAPSTVVGSVSLGDRMSRQRFFPAIQPG